jgi:hypothetical protein
VIHELLKNRLSPLVGNEDLEDWLASATENRKHGGVVGDPVVESGDIRQEDIPRELNVELWFNDDLAIREVKDDRRKAGLGQSLLSNTVKTPIREHREFAVSQTVDRCRHVSLQKVTRGYPRIFHVDKKCKRFAFFHGTN